MRTKALICAAALTAAGVASSMAQVYSVNAVGYVKVAVPVGFSMIANPLDAGAGNNTVGKLMPTPPDGTTIYKYNGTQFDIYSFDSFLGGWQPDGNLTLAPGEGAFVNSPAAATNTFVGEVEQGSLTNAIPVGFSIKSSQVPQAGLLTTDLKYTPADGTTVYTFNTTTKAYDIYSFDSFLGGWQPAEPNIAVGQSFWVSAPAAGAWTRTFSVNTP